MLLVDFYSKFMEVDGLRDTRSCTVIETLKAQFSRHSIPATMQTDNGPQRSSEEFKNFCKSYSIHHVTSSQHTPHSNSEAECAVQTVKMLWRKAPDKHLARLDYRTNPLESVGLSPPHYSWEGDLLVLSTAYDPKKVKCPLDQTKVI